LDIMMARTNGVDVAIALQRAFKGSPTPLPPIVAMTANTSAQDVTVARWVLCCRSINMLQLEIQLEHPPC
jgi:CheY-like chemotaxis protein